MDLARVRIEDWRGGEHHLGLVWLLLKGYLHLGQQGFGR